MQEDPRNSWVIGCHHKLFFASQADFRHELEQQEIESIDIDLSVQVGIVTFIYPYRFPLGFLGGQRPVEKAFFGANNQWMVRCRDFLVLKISEVMIY